MNAPLRIAPSVCPHDCTSTCALEVELLDACTIGRVRGSKRNTYTAGTICEKVARYAERVHHPDRLTHPLLRNGPKGSGQWKRIGWEEALDRVAAQFSKEDATPVVIVQHRHGDRFFPAAHVERLEQLMACWRVARDGGPALTDAESAELDQLIELETLAAGERGAAVMREASS